VLDHRISAAWREAAEQLGIRVVAPHSLRLPNGDALDVEAFLPDFGGPNGVVAVAMSDDRRCCLADASAQYVSRIAECYRAFDGPLFRETLDDWGWFGPEALRPDWYAGYTAAAEDQSGATDGKT